MMHLSFSGVMWLPCKLRADAVLCGSELLLVTRGRLIPSQPARSTDSLSQHVLHMLRHRGLGYVCGASLFQRGSVSCMCVCYYSKHVWVNSLLLLTHCVEPMETDNRTSWETVCIVLTKGTYLQGDVTKGKLLPQHRSPSSSVT